MLGESNLKLKQFGDAYAHILTPVFITSVKDQSIVLANSSAAKCCGYRKSEMPGLTFLDLFKADDRDRILAMIEAGNELGIYSEFNLRVIRKSGRMVIIDLTGRRVSKDGEDLIIFTLHDITALKIANEDLEKKVKSRTSDLEASKNRIQTILNSSLQGFFTFGPNLTIEGDYSLKAAQILGDDLEGRQVAEALNLSSEMIGNLSILIFKQQKWDLVQQVSTFESEVCGKYISVHFAPIYEGQIITRVLGTVTDVTPMKLLQKRAEKSAKESRCLVKILQSRTIFLKVLETINHLEIDASDPLVAKRYVHTLKGEFAFFECDDLVEVCQIWEQKWESNYQSKDFQEFLKQLRCIVDEFIERYDSLLKINSQARKEISLSLEGMKDLVQRAAQISGSNEMLESIEKVLEIPIEEGLRWLGDIWILASKSLGKKVEPIIWEKSKSLFIEPYQKLITAMVHGVRNAADHGIESPDERLALGKPEKGRLSVTLELKEEFYHLYLRDDGRGIQIDRVKSKAQNLGFPVPEKEEQIMSLLFEPEFSTRDKRTLISGAGIGLNAIREEARALSGDAKISNLSSSGAELHVWFKKIPIAQAL